MSEPGREFLDLLSATVALGAFRSVLAEVVALAEEAANLSDEQLRSALVSLDHATRRLADGEAVSAHGAVGDPPGVLRARSGAVLSPVAAPFSDRSRGSPGCAACTERTAGSGPVTGWPLVEVPPTPGGQPVPSPARPPDLRCEPHLARRVGGVVCELHECGQRPLSTAPHELDFSSGALHDTHDVMVTWTFIGLVIYAVFVLAAVLPDEIDNRRYWAALKKRRSRSRPPNPVGETDNDEQ